MQEPLFPPDSSWTIPREFPRLEGARRIGFDVETHDPHLRARGPGFLRGDAHIAGVAVAVPEGQAWYWPIRHLRGPNLPPNVVLEWVKDEVAGRPEIALVGANLPYDLEACAVEGIRFKNPICDIQIAEPLIDENRNSYELDDLSHRYLGEGKREGLLQQALRDYGYYKKGKKGIKYEKGAMAQLPAKYVGPYAEADARQALAIWDAQQPILQEQDLGAIFALESALVPILLEMRLQGVRVDVDAAERLYAELGVQLKQKNERVAEIVGFPINIEAPTDLARAFRELGLQPGVTAKGRASYAEGVLQGLGHPLGDAILECRSLRKLREEYVRLHILGNVQRGHIHCQFNQLRDSQGGTRTGRFSSKNPNLQQVPKRTETGKLLRTVFLPEDGEQWCSADFSQQEPRIMVHYASLLDLPGAEDAVQYFMDDPDADYYMLLVEIGGITRPNAKIVQLAISYGMGEAKGAAKMGMTPEEYRQFRFAFDARLRWLSILARRVNKQAERRGWIRTLGGRRRRFDLWEPAQYSEEFTPALPRDLAEQRYGGQPLRRAGAHKAFNSLIQGSGADMMKAALLKTYETLGQAPLLTVHDELDLSVPKGPEGRRRAETVVECMRTALPVRVPMKVDLSLGPNWGAC